MNRRKIDLYEVIKKFIVLYRQKYHSNISKEVSHRVAFSIIIHGYPKWKIDQQQLEEVQSKKKKYTQGKMFKKCGVPFRNGNLIRNIR